MTNTINTNANIGTNTNTSGAKAGAKAGTKAGTKAGVETDSDMTTSSNVNDRNSFRLSSRIEKPIVDLTDTSYTIDDNDDVNILEDTNTPMLTLSELATVYIMTQDAHNAYGTPDVSNNRVVVYQVRGDTREHYRMVALVRGRPPTADSNKAFFINCEFIEYFDDNDTSLTCTPLKMIEQFFTQSGYGRPEGYLWEYDNQRACGATLQ